MADGISFAQATQRRDGIGLLPDVKREPTLRKISLIAILAGAAASVFFVLYAGRRNPSMILMTMFVIWVLGPFVAMLRIAMPRLSPTIAILSTGYYAWVALGPPRPQAAAPFLIIPLLSWLVLAAAFLRFRQNNNS